MKPVFILEMQDGMMCQNNTRVVKAMIDSVIKYRPEKTELIFKWQLYKKIDNGLEMIPLAQKVFDFAFKYAHGLGFKTTASVFDLDSLLFLSQYNPPFIKIACKTDKYEWRKGLWEMAMRMPYNRYFMSVKSEDDYTRVFPYATPLCCVPNYPATQKEYFQNFGDLLKFSISDHTKGMDFYREYYPSIFEKHFYLPGLDSYDKDWAMTPEDMRWIL